MSEFNGGWNDDPDSDDNDANEEDDQIFVDNAALVNALKAVADGDALAYSIGTLDDGVSVMYYLRTPTVEDLVADLASTGEELADPDDDGVEQSKLIDATGQTAWYLVGPADEETTLDLGRISVLIADYRLGLGIE